MVAILLAIGGLAAAVVVAAIQGVYPVDVVRVHAGLGLVWIPGAPPGYLVARRRHRPG